MGVYTTYFDSNFMIQGIACLDSLIRHARDPVSIRVLALDDTCASLLADLIGQLPDGTTLHVESLLTFERRYPELQAARVNRSRTEYIFTLTPFLCRDALNHTSADDWCIYLDADTYFFADPALALQGLEDAEVALTEHRFPDETAHLANAYGRFNVGWLAFRPGIDSNLRLADWSRLCLESCSLEASGERFGDQKYLDPWPAITPHLVVVDHPGVNTAPWNAARHVFTQDVGGHPLVDGQPLVLFHFHRLARRTPILYETDYRDYGTLSDALQAYVYPPYIAKLDDLWRRHGHLIPADPRSSSRQGSLPRRTARILLATLRLFSRRRVVFKNGRALGPFESIACG